MKSTLTILALAFLFCGCSKKPAIDFVQAGKDTTWNQGAYNLQVAKRNGDSLGSIRLVLKTSGGQDTIITAETGTVTAGSVENPADPNCVRVTLFNAQDNMNLKPAKQLMYVLRK
jgi:hypothetical protein